MKGMLDGGSTMRAACDHKYITIVKTAFIIIVAVNLFAIALLTSSSLHLRGEAPEQRSVYNNDGVSDHRIIRRLTTSSFRDNFFLIALSQI